MKVSIEELEGLANRGDAGVHATMTAAAAICERLDALVGLAAMPLQMAMKQAQENGQASPDTVGHPPGPYPPAPGAELSDQAEKA